MKPEYSCIFFFMDDLIVLLKVLDMLHDLFENFGAVLWSFTRQILISSFNWLRTFWLFSQSANEDLVSIISLTFCARVLHLSLMTAPSTSLSVPYSKSYRSRRARRIKIKKGNFLFNYSHYYLIWWFFSSLEKPVCDRNKWTCPYKSMKNRQSIYAQS